MSNAFNKISSFVSLNEAWKNLWNSSRPKSRETSGVDGESLNDFSINSVANLQSISRSLRKGTYTLSGLKPHFIIKPNGKIRVICVPCTRDRIVQGALLKFLSDKYTARFSNEVSYGFLKNRDVKKALLVAQSKRKKNPWVFKTDIKAFFDNIQRTDLKNKIRTIIKERSLHLILEAIVSSEIVISSNTEKRKLAQLEIKNGVGVRQGMPLSPFFSNIVLERFDRAATSAGYSALRYADDLIFFSASKVFCAEIESFCAKELKKVDLDIPPSGKPDSKTIIYSPKEDAEFLGLSISPEGAGYIIKVSSNQIAKILETFNHLSNVKELLARKLTIGRLGTYLKARKSGYINAYDLCSNIADLENQLEGVEQTILKKLYQNELHINLSTISSEAYTFLGLRNKS